MPAGEVSPADLPPESGGSEQQEQYDLSIDVFPRLHEKDPYRYVMNACFLYTEHHLVQRRSMMLFAVFRLYASDVTYSDIVTVAAAGSVCPGKAPSRRCKMPGTTCMRCVRVVALRMHPKATCEIVSKAIMQPSGTLHTVGNRAQPALRHLALFHECMKNEVCRHKRGSIQKCKVSICIYARGPISRDCVAVSVQTVSIT